MTGPSSSADAVILTPHYGVGIGVVALGLVALLLTPLWGGALWLGMGVGLLGLLLLLQTTLLRLEFNNEALVVWSRKTQLRRFPYSEWLSYTLFWPWLPVVFYFREVKSIHLLPMLFDAAGLSHQLEAHLPHLRTTAEKPVTDQP